MKRIGGMFANLPTPFSRDGERIDFAIVRERIEWLVEAGIHGFSTQLSAGEFAHLGLDERRSLTQVVVKAVKGRPGQWARPGPGRDLGNSLAESIELARHAGELGATAAMLMPRSYFKLTEDEVRINDAGQIVGTVDVDFGGYTEPSSVNPMIGGHDAECA